MREAERRRLWSWAKPSGARCSLALKTGFSALALAGRKPRYRILIPIRQLRELNT